MSNAHEQQNIPTRSQAAIFRLKAGLLRFRRLLLNATSLRTKRFASDETLLKMPVIARSVTPLWTETEPQEKALVAGKIHNLRLAVSKLNGIEIPAGEIFSFWKHVGRAGRWQGYVAGREIREGCLIPSVGGGLCQLSNALYDAALQAKFEIIERHAHTQVIAGSLAEKGRDATVFWNYVDLRFSSPNAFRIEIMLDGKDLTVVYRGLDNDRKKIHQINRGAIHVSQIGSCATCGLDDCHRALPVQEDVDFGRTAYLVDGYKKEFDEHIQRTKKPDDVIFIPLDGKRFRKPNYSWTTKDFSKVNQSVLLTLLRSYRSRKLASQGAARQKNLLEMYEKLALSYAGKLNYDCLHVVVQQELLPFLWRSGHLGGRTFDVLMTALPMAEIQKTLDRAFQLHPESKTLGDFRADEKLIAAEKEALQNARKMITPHSAIASLFGERAELLSWTMPKANAVRTSAGDKPLIVFPASTVGRKGCYELRDALRGMGIKLMTMGPYLESKDFWNGFDIVKPFDDWKNAADMVVLPAFVEHDPRRLLMAAANGIPVIASEMCGVSNVDGVTLVPAGDGEKLREAISANLTRKAAASA